MDFGLSGGTERNLLVSLTDASDLVHPDPVSGLVITISLRRFNCSIAVNSVLGGCGIFTLDVVEGYGA